jgi:hypothetical protein
LQGLIGDGIPKRPNEELGIENILSGLGPHCSVSGGTMETPSMARVPRIRDLWNKTRSRARSIVSVAVEAPSARCAAWIFANGKLYVRGTPRAGVRSVRRAVVAI